MTKTQYKELEERFNTTEKDLKKYIKENEELKKAIANQKQTEESQNEKLHSLQRTIQLVKERLSSLETLLKKTNIVIEKVRYVLLIHRIR